MALGRGKTEHNGARDLARKGGYWGTTDRAKYFASKARRRDAKREISAAMPEVRGPGETSRND